MLKMGPTITNCQYFKIWKENTLKKAMREEKKGFNFHLSESYNNSF
jgi:hypothetical protein